MATASANSITKVVPGKFSSCTSSRLTLELTGEQSMLVIINCVIGSSVE
jgi:hypothetical protein